MFSAAARFQARAVLALLAGGVGPLDAGDNSARSTPSRPKPAAATTAVAVKKIGGTNYVSATDAAKALGLKLTVVQRGRKIALTGGNVRAELENDTREIAVNGLRVFLGDPVVDSRGELYVSRIDFERCLTPLLRPGYGTAARPPPKVIALDPGHGGRDTGTSTHEKVYALDVARRAEKILEAAGFTVVLTRDKDVFLDLQDRAAFANAKRADLFVSIHFNALVRDTKTSGVEIFTFAPQFQRSADAWSPLKKDDTEDFASPVNRYDHWSTVLSQAIQRRFVNDLKAFDRGKKLAHWGVLRGLNCPGVLVECGFLTSDVEARKIATPEYRQQLAAALAAGVRDYATTLEALRPAKG